MPKLDKAKEELSYLKFWLGIIVAVLISLCGWIVSNLESNKNYYLVASLLFVLVLLVCLYFIHKKIKDKIDYIGDLKK